MRITTSLLSIILLSALASPTKAGELRVAVLVGDIEKVAYLLSAGANVNETDDSDRTPLMEAVLGGQNAIAKLLLDRGAYIEAKDLEGSTALMKAALIGNDAAVNLLLDRGANIEARNKEGETPLMYAAYKEGEPETVKLLLERGADIEALNNYGRGVPWQCKGAPTIRILETELAKLRSSLDVVYWLKKNKYDDPKLTETLIAAKNRQLPDFLTTATNDQKIELLTAVERQIARATATIDELNGQAADAIAKKQDAAPYRARVGQVKAYINVLNEIKAILEQS
jgi:hypothetical protein